MPPIDPVLFAAILAILCVFAFVIGFVLGRRQRSRPAAKLEHAREIAPGDPDRGFYDMCASFGFRYLGDRDPSLVHGVLVSMPKAGEMLFARVPATEGEFLEDLHPSRCTECAGRLFDLYVTGCQTRLDRAVYGDYAAYLIARVCGGCGRVHEWPAEQPDEVTFQWSVNVMGLRSAGNAHDFIRKLRRQSA